MKILKGFASGFSDATQETGYLSKLQTKCDAVQLSVWTVKDDTTDAPTVEKDFIFYGFDQANMQFYAGQPSDYIYVDDVRDLLVRAAVGKNTRIFYSLFRLVEK